MKIYDLLPPTKKKMEFLYFTAITILLLLVFILLVNNKLNADKEAVRGIIVEVQSGKDPKQSDIYFVDKHGNMKNLTNQSGNHIFPSWSPDGRRITFIAYRNDRRELYIMDADGSNQRLLYRPNKDEYIKTYRPRWHPDGKKIAFLVVDTSKLENSGYKIIDLTEPITETVRFDIELQKKMPGHPAVSLAWSPDGKKISFIEKNFIGSGQKDDILFVMDSDGKNKKELARFCMIYNDAFLWSPDSKKIAFVSTKVDATIDGRNVTDIYIVDVGNLSITNLTKGKDLPFTEQAMPTWSPDSKQIAFISVSPLSALKNLGRGIYVINAETLELKRLTEYIVDTSPSWSPDGSQIAFLSNREIDVATYNQGQYFLRAYIMNSDGKNVKRLTDFKHPRDYVSCIQPPLWSPVK